MDTLHRPKTKSLREGIGVKGYSNDAILMILMMCYFVHEKRKQCE
jgi:hypothetical protein